MTFRLSAGVYNYEYVRSSGIFNNVNSTIGASVFASRKGPLGPTLITGGNEEFIKLYGESDISWSQAHLCLQPALNEMTVFYGNRVVNGAKYAGLSFYYDSLNKKLFTAPFTAGTTKDYKDASVISKLISFSDAIPSESSISATIGTESITTNFNTTSNYTLSLFASQIQAVLDNLGEGGSAKVIKTWEYSDRKMEVRVTFDKDFVINDVTTFTIEGVPGITSFTAESTFESGTLANYLQTIATGITTNSNNTIQATVIEDAATPTFVLTCVNAGPVNLTVNATSTNSTAEVKTIREGHGVYDDRSILVVLPESIDSLNMEVTVPSSTVTVDINDNAKIMDIFAENPGSWASSTKEGLGVKISALDKGISQRTRITISQAIVADNSFTCNIGYNGNTWTTTPVVFTTSSDNTLKLIAESIQTLLDTNVGLGGQVYVEEVTGGSENDRSIMIITPSPSQVIDITDALFVGGQTQPIALVRNVIPNTPSNETFTLSVYSRESMKTPLETWTVSFKLQLDASGNQMYITDRVNGGVYKSTNIRVNVYNNDFSYLTDSDSIAWLGGGDDGYLPTTSQIIEGWEQFADPEEITVRLLINCGYTNTSIQQKIASIAENRKDCFAILDMPSDKQLTQAAYDYRQYELNVNTSYAAIYSPDVLVFDTVSGTDTYIAPSGYVAAQICYTERTRAIWWAPAGLNRGVLSNAKGLRVLYGSGDRDILEPVHINPIVNKKANGFVIYGEYTLQTAIDPLQDLHVRLLMNNIEIACTDAMEYKLWDPNDEYLRTVMVKEISDYLKPIKDARGLRDYRVVSDITKENAADIDAGVAVVSTYVKPVSSTKFIRLNNYILGSGVSFEEVIENGV